MNSRKLFRRILASPHNVRFDEFVHLIGDLGFHLDRISGSHHIYKNRNIRELINIQNVDGQAKPYQIRQFLKLVEKYNLRLEDEP